MKHTNIYRDLQNLRCSIIWESESLQMDRQSGANCTNKKLPEMELYTCINLFGIDHILEIVENMQQCQIHIAPASSDSSSLIVCLHVRTTPKMVGRKLWLSISYTLQNATLKASRLTWCFKVHAEYSSFNSNKSEILHQTCWRRGSHRLRAR